MAMVEVHPTLLFALALGREYGRRRMPTPEADELARRAAELADAVPRWGRRTSPALAHRLVGPLDALMASVACLAGEDEHATAREAERLRALVDEELTQAEIAERLGAQPSIIRRRLAFFGLEVAA